MTDARPFALLITVIALALLVAVAVNRVRVPAPAIFLIGAAAASDLVPAWGRLSPETVGRIVTVALVVVLFDGGMGIGRRRFRTAAGSIAWVGVAGTFVTAAAVAACAHGLFGLGWQTSLLLGAALSPTDPAVVFAVLGRREIQGRSSTLLEGESGANDPVGIALMAALLAAGGATGWSAVGVGVREFAVQMSVGGVAGVLGGLGLAAFSRRVRLPHPGLYPLRSLAGAGLIYGVTTIAGGSGFLAVFVAGILLGDVAAPFQDDVRRVSTALASLGEIVAFTVLGLTVSLRGLPAGHAWQIGLGLAVLLAVLIRPVLVGLLLLRVRLTPGEKVFVLWCGLKGAVPILLGTFVLASGAAEADRIYGIIFVAVAFSVIVQGGLVGWMAKRCGVPVRERELRPWPLGIRLAGAPELLSYVVEAGAPADGAAAGTLAEDHGVWIALLVRDGALVPVSADTVVRAGDEAHVHRPTEVMRGASGT
ncbi:cation:proton antiporter domain-containing protein [Hamadaea tsunoensis]|uniref:cation:proton antiporter domain-containing protein n=1 Tax=Hamadaea tsunoensis TaxID=53368 RepID=UPI00041FCEDB|nr:cation:proton antiporter [Hamadaea tsunoensis]